jgi:hypothetical protein
MTLITDTQQTAEWFQARCGKATASRFKDVLAKLKSGAPAAARESYLIEVATERLTNSAVSHFSTPAMQWGTTHEAAARTLYEARFNVEVEQIGFVAHDLMAAGASPDGLVDWDGLIEIKCPFNPTNHVNTLRNGMPVEHMAQIQGQLWITDRRWCDFVSFDPRMPSQLQLYVQRVERDDMFIGMLTEEVSRFLGEVDEMIATIMEKAQ